MLIPCVLLLGLFCFLRYVPGRMMFWLEQGDRMLKEPGYLPPAPSIWARTAKDLICRVLVFVGVGPRYVIGDTNPDTQGRLIVCANHQDEWDFAILEALLPLGYRTMAAINQIHGIRVPLAAWTGTIVLDYTSNEAKKAMVEASIKVMSKADAKMMIFPEGHMVRRREKGKVIRGEKLLAENFRTGTIRIVRGAAKETGEEEASILPVGIYFLEGSEHMTWFHRLVYSTGYRLYRIFRWLRSLVPRWFGRTRQALRTLGKFSYRLPRLFRQVFGHMNCGVVISIGKPIRGRRLPEDVREATEELRLDIQEQFNKAKEYALAMTLHKRAMAVRTKRSTCQ